MILFGKIWHRCVRTNERELKLPSHRQRISERRGITSIIAAPPFSGTERGQQIVRSAAGLRIGAARGLRPGSATKPFVGAREAAIVRNDLIYLSGMPCHCFYRPAGGTLVSTNGGSVWRGVVRSFMGCSLMRPGALGALALLPARSASRFKRLLIM